MTHFLRNGTSFRISNEVNMDLHSRLPAGNYTIQQDQFGNMFLDQVEGFNISGKLYGDIESRAQRILNTFYSRSSSTGVLLTGEKGSGKSLLAKLLCQTAAVNNIPTVIVSNPRHGEKFNSFIQSINHECVVLFDEFEKTYDAEQQESLLTLLDGVFPSKKLFVLTCNDKFRIDTHMRNRPGRIFYTLDYKGLTEDFIREYCQDNLEQTQYIDQICSIAAMFSSFNFDMLKALIEEMNRYQESPDKSLEMLNVKAEYSGHVVYTVSLETADGQPIPQELVTGETEVMLNPLSVIDYPIDLRILLPEHLRVKDDENDEDQPVPSREPVQVSEMLSRRLARNSGVSKEVKDFYKSIGLPNAEHAGEAGLRANGFYVSIAISTENLMSVDSRKGAFVFKGGTGHIVKLRKKPETTRSMYGLAY